MNAVAEDLFRKKITGIDRLTKTELIKRLIEINKGYEVYKGKLYGYEKKRLIKMLKNETKNLSIKVAEIITEKRIKNGE